VTALHPLIVQGDKSHLLSLLSQGNNKLGW